MKILLISSLFLISCGSRNEKPANIPSGNGEVKPTVSIDSVQDINASNAKSFMVSGSCSEEGKLITVSVGGVSPTTTPICSNGVWETTLDVTNLNKISKILITANQTSSSGENSTQVTANITNNFLCPENFIAVPSLSDYTTNSFCVMKYEAKNDGSGGAVSQATGTPYVNINRSNAIAKCIELGENYDLITNDEWQSLARNIELIASNWDTGTIGASGGLNQGHSDVSGEFEHGLSSQQ